MDNIACDRRYRCNANRQGDGIIPKKARDKLAFPRAKSPAHSDGRFIGNGFEREQSG